MSGARYPLQVVSMMTVRRQGAREQHLVIFDAGMDREQVAQALQDDLIEDFRSLAQATERMERLL